MKWELPQDTPLEFPKDTPLEIPKDTPMDLPLVTPKGNLKDKPSEPKRIIFIG